MTKLEDLSLSNNNISDISAVTGLAKLRWLFLEGNNISDISPLVANTGLGTQDSVDLYENPLSYRSVNTYIPSLLGRGVGVGFALVETPPEFLLSLPAGQSLIHVPLRVIAIDDAEQTIESIADLYDALGGTSKVNFLLTHDSQAQEWRGYFGTSDTGTPADRALTDDMGILTNIKAPVSIRLTGSPLGTNGTTTITLNPGLNLVGLPLRHSRLFRVSDLFTLEGIRGSVSVIILTDNGEFKLVAQPRDPGDIEISGGQSFILNASRAATVTIVGEAWTDDELTVTLTIGDSD